MWATTPLGFVIEREIRASDGGYEGAHIVVTVYDDVCAAAWQVPSTHCERKQRVTGRSTNRPDKVVFYLAVERTYLHARQDDDGYLSTKVKTRMAEGVRLEVKVVAENGVIYLLGKITPSDADAVVAEAKNPSGLKKIIGVFDYLLRTKLIAEKLHLSVPKATASVAMRSAKPRLSPEGLEFHFEHIGLKNSALDSSPVSSSSKSSSSNANPWPESRQ